MPVLVWSLAAAVATPEMPVTVPKTLQLWLIARSLAYNASDFSLTIHRRRVTWSLGLEAERLDCRRGPAWIFSHPACGHASRTFLIGGLPMKANLRRVVRIAGSIGLTVGSAALFAAPLTSLANFGKPTPGVVCHLLDKTFGTPVKSLNYIEWGDDYSCVTAPLQVGVIKDASRTRCCHRSCTPCTARPVTPVRFA